MIPSELDINQIIGIAIGTIGGGIGSHWVKMRRDIKSAHAKLRTQCERIEILERKVKDYESNSKE